MVHRRSSVLKTLWNLACLSLQMVVAIAVFRLVNDVGDATHWLAWVAAYAGCLVANRVSVLAVAWSSRSTTAASAAAAAAARRRAPATRPRPWSSPSVWSP